MPNSIAAEDVRKSSKKHFLLRIKYDRLAIAISTLLVVSFLGYKLIDSIVNTPIEKFELAPDNAILYIHTNTPQKLIDSLNQFKEIPFLNNYCGQLLGIKALLNPKSNPFQNSKGILSACFVSPDGPAEFLHIVHSSYLLNPDALSKTNPTYQNPEHLEKRNFRGSPVYEVRLPEDTGVWCFTSVKGHILISRDPFMIDNYLLKKSKVISNSAGFSSIPAATFKQPMSFILQTSLIQSLGNLAANPFLKKSLSTISSQKSLFAGILHFEDGTLQLDGKMIFQNKNKPPLQRILSKHPNPSSLLSFIPADVTLIQSFSIEDPDAFLNDIPSNSTTGKQYFDEWLSGNWAFCKLQEDDFLVLESKNATQALTYLSKTSNLLADDSLYYKGNAFNPYELKQSDFINKTFSNQYFSISPSYFFSINNVVYFYSKKHTAVAILNALSKNITLSKDQSFLSSYSSPNTSANFLIYFNPSIAGAWWGNANNSFDSNVFFISQKLSPLCFTVSNQGGYASAKLSLGSKSSSTSSGNTLWKHSHEANISSDLYLLKSTSGNDYVAFQDEQSYLHLISTTGQKLWSKWVDGNVINALFEMDCYRNGEKQFAFTTENFLYVIDKEGNYVSDFPVKISTPAKQGADMFYISSQERYLFFIPLQNHSIIAYNTSGIPEAPWNPMNLNTSSTNPVSKIHAISQKNILIEYESSTYKSLDILGQPNASFEANAHSVAQLMINDSLCILRASEKGMFIQGSSGSLTPIKTKVKLLPNNCFVRSDKQHFLYSHNKDQLVCLNTNGEILFASKLSQPLKNLGYAVSNLNTTYFAAQSQSTNDIFIWNEKGDFLNKFPWHCAGFYKLMKRTKQQDVILIYQDSPNSVSAIKL